MESSDYPFPLQPCTVLMPDVLYPIIGRPTNDQIDGMILLSGECPVFLTIELEGVSVEMLAKIERTTDGKRRFEGLIANRSRFASVEGAFTGTSRGTLQLVN